MNLSSLWCDLSDCAHLGNFSYGQKELAVCHRRIWAM